MLARIRLQSTGVARRGVEWGSVVAVDLRLASCAVLQGDDRNRQNEGGGEGGNDDKESAAHTSSL